MRFTWKTGAPIIPEETIAQPASNAVFRRLLYERIEAARNNPGELRVLVYEVARKTLNEQFAGVDGDGLRQLRDLLETAIADVEKKLSHGAEETVASVRPAPPSGTEKPLETTPMGRDPVRMVASDFASKQAGGLLDRTGWPRQSQAVAARLIFVLLGIVVFSGLVLTYWPGMRPMAESLWSAYSHRAGRTMSPVKAASSPAGSEPAGAPVATSAPNPPSEPAAVAPPPVPQTPPPPFPLPTTFGIYVVSEDQLRDLKTIPGRVPDRRVAVSAPILTASASSVPNGKVKFILFRSDVLRDTPIAAEVRVVAKVSLAMGVDSSGKASTAPVSQSWVIRSKSFPFKIGPLDGQQGMLLVEPEDENLVLTPGRYVLVLKGIGYDFEVAGKVTDPDQCVERIAAANGAFYSPCPPR